MQTYFVRCKRKAICHHCKEYITAGSAMIKQRHWGQGIFPKKMAYWHLDCWIESNMARLELKQPVMNPETRRQRRKLTMKRARLVQRIKECEAEGKDWLVPGLEEKLVGVRQDIEQIGGVPDGW